MVDDEVESILLEIRERVRAQAVPASEIANSATENGNGESSITPGAAAEASTAETLARVESHLTTTARAWDRLPPLVSNRSGGIARLELWVKGQLKRSTRWFAWEQINFNAAVHHALRDMLDAQRTAQFNSRQAIESLRGESEGQRTMLEKNQAGLKAQQEEIKAQGEKLEAQRRELQAQREKIEAQRESQQQEMAAHRNEMNARLSELTQELRQRDERVREEQRVCFKQLSLEATEAAVLEDRARRKTATLLEELRRRVEQIEKQ